MGTNPCSGRGEHTLEPEPPVAPTQRYALRSRGPVPDLPWVLPTSTRQRADPAVDSLAEQLDRLDINTISTSIKEPPYRQFIIDEPLVY